MRRTRLIPLALIALTLFSLSCAGAARRQEIKPKRGIVGRWQGIDRTGKEGAFNFFENGTMELIIDGKSLGAAEQGGFGGLTYTINFDKEPIELDIVGKDPSGAERGKILMIIKFLSDDKIKLRTFFNDLRPDDFDNESIDDTIILDRKLD